MRSSTRWLPLFSALVFVSSLLTLSVAPAAADVKTRDKGQVKFEGMLGTMMRMFGGKALAEGIVSTNALKGNRKATLNDTTGRIVDLDEQKVYDLDMKKKSYTVTTFEQLRQKLREAQERAAKDAPNRTTTRSSSASTSLNPITVRRAKRALRSTPSSAFRHQRGSRSSRTHSNCPAAWR